MKRFLFYLLIGVILVFNTTWGYSQKDHTKIRVVLDPGHGGADSGAVGVKGIKEKDVVLKIAEETIRLNRELYDDIFQIYLTRYSDTLISLADRTKLARALSADAFVSIHCNQASRKEAQGIEVYFDGNSKESNELAILFAIGLNNKLGFKNRGMKYGNFQVLRETPDIPSVLLELGFLSNSEEAIHSANDASISGYALLIVETLLEFSGYE